MTEVTSHPFCYNIRSNKKIFEFRIALILGHDQSVLFNQVFLFSFFRFSIFKFLLHFFYKSESHIQVCRRSSYFTRFFDSCAPICSINSNKQNHKIINFKIKFYYHYLLLFWDYMAFQQYKLYPSI